MLPRGTLASEKRFFFLRGCDCWLNGLLSSSLFLSFFLSFFFFFLSFFHNSPQNRARRSRAAPSTTASRTAPPTAARTSERRCLADSMASPGALRRADTPSFSFFFHSAASPPPRYKEFGTVDVCYPINGSPPCGDFFDQVLDDETVLQPLLGRMAQCSSPRVCCAVSTPFLVDVLAGQDVQLGRRDVPLHHQALETATVQWPCLCRASDPLFSGVSFSCAYLFAPLLLYIPAAARGNAHCASACAGGRRCLTRLTQSPQYNGVCQEAWSREVDWLCGNERKERSSSSHGTCGAIKEPLLPSPTSRVMCQSKESRRARSKPHTYTQAYTHAQAHTHRHTKSFSLSPQLFHSIRFFLEEEV